mgnify:FL=1
MKKKSTLPAYTHRIGEWNGMAKKNLVDKGERERKRKKTQRQSLKNKIKCNEKKC